MEHRPFRFFGWSYDGPPDLTGIENVNSGIEKTAVNGYNAAMPRSPREYSVPLGNN